MKSYFTNLFFWILVPFCTGQNTLGLISISPSETYEGYNLIYPENQENVYLLDVCGRVVNIWTDSLSRPGKTAYLTKEGNLLKAKTSGFLYNNSFGTGGAGGVVEIRSWEDDLLWQYIVADSLVRQHHDVLMMPNGNVMMIVWERKNFNEMVENGFDTLANIQNEIWTDKIIEVNPLTSEVVWEWQAWDHMVQDINSQLINFGLIHEHPQRIDINYHQYTFDRQDWLHINSIDYNEDLDQVIIGVRNFQEIWIIDHSTTIEEAASTTGGNSNMGGDLLYRWGNPKAYQRGMDQERQLFFQHDVQWVGEFVPSSSDYYGKIALYNNFIADDLSLGQIMTPVWNSDQKRYEKNMEGTFLPVTFDNEFSHPDTLKGFSTAASSIQVLPNDNILICAGRQGRSFELNQSGEIVWEYITPLINGFPAPQGVTPSLSTNFTFQIERYPIDFEGFIDKDLSPGEFLELQPSFELCSLVSSTDMDIQAPKLNMTIYNTLVDDFLEIHTSRSTELAVYNVDGYLFLNKQVGQGMTQWNVSILTPGMYIIRDIQSNQSIKVIKI